MRTAIVVLALASFATVTAQDGTAPPKVDFDKQIAPLLVQRCIECHGPEKDKGDLRLDQRAFAFPAEDPDVWTIQAGKPGDSEMIRRITLPDGDDDIMPAKGEPLSKAQQELITRWIAEGAVWTATGDAVIKKAIESAVLPKTTFVLPLLDDAGRQTIAAAVKALEDKGAVVQRVAADTEALDVNLSLLRDKVTDVELAMLEPLAPVLVWLNVSRTAVSDKGAASLGKLVQLRRLHAASTKLGDATAKAITGLQQLEFLNLYGTAITDDALPHLQTLGKLQKLHAWQTKVTPAGVKAIRDHFAKFEIDLGDYAEERMAAAAKEIAEREAAKVAMDKPINEICPVLDKPIDPEQTVEHEGRRIAFCCKKCKAAFEKDPAKFADKLPKVPEQPAEKTAEKKK